MVGRSFWASVRSSGVTAFVWLVLSTLLSPMASAQGGSSGEPPPTEAEVAEARRIFAVGIRHADRGEWEDAVVCFRQVLEVRQAPPVLFNLGAALVALGQYPEAEPLLRRVADDPSAEASLVERARASLTTMQEHGGRLTIEIVRSTPSTIVTIDGLVLEASQLGTEFAVSAATHEVVVRDGADEITRRQVAVAVGQSASITLAASGDASAVTDADAEGAEDAALRASHTEIGTTLDVRERRRQRLRNPWLWTGVGAGVVVVGAVLFVAIYDPRVNDPANGNTTPAVIRF